MLVWVWLSVQESRAQVFLQSRATIYFDSDKDELKPEFKDALRSHMINIGTTSIRKIEIIGHADSDASESYNLELSERRAKAAENFLVTQGVKSNMIVKKSLGESEPVSEDKKFNRRVDLVFEYYRDIPVEFHTRKRIIRGWVFDAVSKERLQAEVILEFKERQDNLKTNSNGYFRVPVQGVPDLSLTILKQGYLNAHYVLNENEWMKTEKDTVDLKFYLNPVQIIEKITLNHIFFHTDTDVLRPESNQDLERLLKVMTDNPKMLIEIQGHMNYAINRRSSPKQEQYNLYLSHIRAKAIYSYLVSHGIERSRLSYRGMSNFKMLYPIPKTPLQEDMNKRVEIYSLKLINS